MNMNISIAFNVVCPLKFLSKKTLSLIPGLQFLTADQICTLQLPSCIVSKIFYTDM